MGKSAKDVIASVPKETQIRGVTRKDVLTMLTLAGYGVKKTEKRTKELLVSAQLQTDGTKNDNGDLLFWSPYWPMAWKAPIGKKLDTSRICAVYYDEDKDPRHNYPLRVDGRQSAWFLE